jgi:septum formation protein
MSDFLYLASQSPRRRQLLEQIGVRFELLLPDAAEDAEALEIQQLGELPADYVRRVTLAKLDAARARRARRGLPDAPVLCSDTTVALGRRILGKPASSQEAFDTLQLLSGQTHRVMTAVALAWDGQLALTLCISKVRFAPVTDAQIRRYVDSGEPFGKAGAYAIQSAAAAWVSHIEGSYSGIMGLPLFETAELLRQAGWAI